MKFIRFRYLNILIGILVLIFLVSKGVNIGKDSIGYINAIPIRSAGYSVIILLFQTIFGKLALEFLFIVQLIVVLFSIQYFLFYLKNKFQLSNFIIFLISFLLYFYYYRYGGNIATEPLSFAFFLLFMKFVLEAIFESDNKSFYISFGLLIILVLIRGQFYFLYPMIIFTVLFLFYKNRDWKFLVKNFTFFILVIIVTNLLDRTYHFVRHDKFIGTPFTGLQLVSDALYVSKLSDSISFEGIDKEIYVKLHQRLSDQGYTLESLKKNKPNIGPSEIVFHYNHAYNEICHRNTKVIVGSYFENSDDINYWNKVDKTTIVMAKKLILRNPLEFIKLYAYDILKNGFKSNVFFIFFVILLIYSLHFIYKSPYNKLYIFLVFASLMFVCNFLLVALVEPILDRYSYYGSIIYYISLFIFVSKWFDSSIKD